MERAPSWHFPTLFQEAQPIVGFHCPLWRDVAGCPSWPCPSLGLWAWQGRASVPSLPAKSPFWNSCLKGPCQDQKCFVNRRGLSRGKGCVAESHPGYTGQMASVPPSSWAHPSSSWPHSASFIPSYFVCPASPAAPSLPAPGLILWALLKAPCPLPQGSL